MGKIEHTIGRLVVAAALLVVAPPPVYADANAYAFLRNSVERHSIKDGLSKDATSEICPALTIETLQDAAANHADLKYDEQDYDNGYLKAGDMIWSLTIGDVMGSKNVTVIVDGRTGGCAAYFYFWTL